MHRSRKVRRGNNHSWYAVEVERNEIHNVRMVFAMIHGALRMWKDSKKKKRL